MNAYTDYQQARGYHPNRTSGDHQRIQRVAATRGWNRLADTIKRAAGEQPADKKSRRTWTKAPLTFDTIAPLPNADGRR